MGFRCQWVKIFEESHEGNLRRKLASGTKWTFLDLSWYPLLRTTTFQDKEKIWNICATH